MLELRGQNWRPLSIGESITINGIGNGSGAIRTIAPDEPVYLPVYLSGDIQLASSASIFSGLDFEIAGSILPNGHVLTLDGNSNTTVSGNISGSGGMIKKGQGTMILSGDSNLIGTTSLSSGSLEVVGSVASTNSIVVGTTAKLAGNGLISGPVTVQSGGIVSPGTLLREGATGILAIGNIDFQINSVLNIEMRGTFSDRINANGSVTIGDNVQLNLINLGFTPNNGDKFTIINKEGSQPVTGTFKDLPDGSLISNFLGSDKNTRINYAGGDGNDVEIEVLTGVATSVRTLINGDLVIDSPGALNDQFVLRADPTGFLLLDGPTTFRWDRSEVYGNITVNTNNGDDYVTIDNSFGKFGNALVTINGGVRKDRLKIITNDGTSTSSYENFDTVTAPALPSGWVTQNLSGLNPWFTRNSGSDSSPNHAFISNPAGISETTLTSPSIPISVANSQLRFRNSYAFDSFGGSHYDGGVLEISIAAGAFQDILTAGGSFVTGGYNGSLNGLENNPLGVRQAWVNSSSGYIDSVVNLPAAAIGQNIKLRWRMGTGAAQSGGGWNIDSIGFSGQSASPISITSTGLSYFGSYNYTNIRDLDIITSGANDTINVAMASSLDGRLFIDGGSGTDTININSAIEIGGDVTLTAESIITNSSIQTGGSLKAIGTTINSGGSIIAQGDVNLTASRNIALSNSAGITANSGNVSLQANASGTTTGSFIGISLQSTAIRTGSGDISIVGKGGDSGVGVEIRSDTDIVSSTGNIVISGSAKQSSNGVYIFQTGTTVTTLGNIQIIGNSQGDHAVLVSESALVSATGSGTVKIEGTATGTSNHGVSILGSAKVNTVNGDLSITGSSSNADGVLISFSGEVVSTGEGIVTLNGTSSSARGVVAVVQGTKIASHNGATRIIGSSQTGTSVHIFDGALVQPTGTATIDISGTGPIIIANAMVLGASEVTLQSVDRGGNADDITLNNATIQSTGSNVSILSDDHVFINGTSTLTAFNALTMTANHAGVDTVGNLTMQSGTTAIGHTMDIAAAGNIVVSSLTADSVITINSISGSIVDDGDIGIDITASGLSISGGAGVGTVTNRLETQLSTLDATGGTGGVFVTNTGDLFIVDLGPSMGVSATGAIHVSTTGFIFAYQPIRSSNGSVSLISTSDIAIFSDITTFGNSILLNSDSDQATLPGGGIRLINANITSNGGDIKLGGGAFPALSNAIGTIRNSNIGILIANSSISSAACNISISGTGEQGGVLNRGVNIQSSRIQSTTGNITISGTGGNSGDSSSGSLLSSSVVNTSSGAISIVGSGGASNGDFNSGIALDLGATIQATGSGSITLAGTGGGTTGNFNAGVGLNGNSNIAVTSGNLNVSAIGGANSGGLDLSVQGNAGQMLSNGSGSIQITATNGSNGPGGITMTNAASVIGGPLATGAITLVTDTYNAPSGLIRSTGSLTIRPASANISIGIGGGVGVLNIDDSELAKFAPAFRSINIGSLSSGNVDIKSSLFKDPVTILGNTISVTELNAGTKAVTLTATNGAITQGGNAGVDITAGALTLNSMHGVGTNIDKISTRVTSLSASATASGGIYIQESDAITFNSQVVAAGGSVVITAGGTIALGASHAINTTLSGTIRLTAARDIALNVGSSLSTQNGGITLEANQQTTPTEGNFRGIVATGATIQSTGSGPIAIRGKGGSDSASGNHDGIYLSGGTGISATVAAAGPGIVLTGTGGDGLGFSDGVFLDGATTEVRNVSGSISITGSSSAGGGRGINIQGDAKVQVTTGNLQLIGTAHSGDSEGVRLSEETGGHLVSLGSGQITVTADGNGNRSDFVAGNNSVIGGSSASGAITINTDSIDMNDSAQIQSTGSLTITPRTLSTTIGLGGGLGTLNLTDGELSKLINGFSSITIGRAGGVGAVDIDSSTFLDPLTIIGGPVSLTELIVADNVNPLDISITSIGAISGGSDVGIDLNARNATLVSTAGVGSASKPLSTKLASLTATASISGGIYVNETDSLNLNTKAVATHSNVVVNAGGTIQLNNNHSIATTGNGSVTLITPRNIILNAGSTVTTVDGGITLLANQQTVPTIGDFIGIFVGGEITSQGLGAITVSGQGGQTGIASPQMGIQLFNGLIQGGATGEVSVTGKAGAGATTSNIGIYLENSQITSSGAAISVAGQGGGTATSFLDMGIWLVVIPQVALTLGATAQLLWSERAESVGEAAIGASKAPVPSKRTRVIYLLQVLAEQLAATAVA